MGFFKDRRYSKLDAILLIVLILFSIIQFYNYLIFHTFMELFSIVVAISVAIIALNNYDRTRNDRLILLGVAYLFIGTLDILHTLAYPGLSIFKNGSTNLAAQIWIIARFIEALSILASLLIKDIRRIKNQIIVFYILVTSGFIFLLLQTNIIPIAYIDGSGLTTIKIISEYTIIIILVIAMFILHSKKNEFVGFSYNYVVSAIFYTILSEISFTLFIDAYGITNAIGHIFKVISFYMIYKGVVLIAINEPFDRLERERVRFYTMFDKAKDAVLLLRENENKKLQVVNANDKACEMFGYNKYNLENHFFDMIFFDDNEKMKALATVTDLESAFFEANLIGVNGNTIHTDVSLNTFEVFENKIKMVDIRDVSVRKKYEEDINIFKTIFESAIESIIVTDRENNIQWVNSSFEKLFGYTADEVIGHNPRMLKSGYQDHLFYKSLWSEINNTGYWRGEMWDKHKNGMIVPIYQSIMTVDSDHYVSVAVDLTSKKEDEMKMYQLAYVNPVTNLNNLHYIEEKLSESRPNGLMFIKFKNLRKIENSYGSRILQDLLRFIIERIQDNNFNQEIFQDSYNHLIIVFEEFIDSELMGNYVLQLQNILGNHFTLDNLSIDLECNISSVINTDSSDYSIIEMIQKTNVAINYLENYTNDHYIEYSPLIEDVLNEEEYIITDLKNSLKNNELDVHFQPFVNIYTGEMFGAEALARWHHPVKGTIFPTKFIPLAENNGFIVELGSFVLEHACKTFSHFWELGHDLTLSVNVSIIQFAHPEFTQTVKNIIAKTSFPPNKLLLELTESVAVDNFEAVKTIMDELHELGIQFALDDFGTGFSSLSMLKQLPISIVKIDRSFIIDINENIQNSLLVSAMIALAHRMGMTVIVEGAEDISQIRYLKNNHCKYVQGYYFSKPVDKLNFRELLGKPFDHIDLDKDELTSIETEKIEHEKERFKLLHQTSPQGFQILSIDGTILEANSLMSSILGYSRVDLVGKNFFDMIIKNEKFDLNKCLETSLKTGRTYDLKVKIMTNKGIIIDALINNIIEYNDNNEPIKIHCLIEDITKNLHKENELIRMREVYRMIFNNAPLAFILWNHDYSIIEWNQHAENIFGWRKNEIIRKKMNFLITDSDFGVWKNRSDRILSGVPLQITMNNITKSGQIIICEWHNEIIYNEEGKVEFVLSIAKDITDSSKNEQEIIDLKDALVSQERLAEIGQLAAGIAHEINNPMSYMISNSSMLKEDIEKYSHYLNDFKSHAESHGYFETNNKKDILDDLIFLEDDFQEIVQSFENGLENIKEIVNSLKSYTWSGEVKDFTKFDILKNIKMVLTIAHNEIKYTSKIIKEFEEDIPVIDGFGNQINQVLLNLIINANHSNQKKYKKEMGTITIKSWSDDLHVFISVGDNGTGIEDEILQSIFDPFFTTKPIGIGTGLGLSISKKIIEETHHGKMNVETKLGEGTNFILQLPIIQN